MRLILVENTLVKHHIKYSMSILLLLNIMHIILTVYFIKYLLYIASTPQMQQRKISTMVTE